MYLRKLYITLLALSLASCGGGGDNSGRGDIKYAPEALYSFDETSGTIALNSKVDALHGEVVGAARVNGIKGGALDFTASNGAHVLFDICCIANPNGGGETIVTFPGGTFTFAAWLKPTEMALDTIYPIFGGWYGSVQSIKIRLNSGAIEFLLYPENNGDAITLVSSSYVLSNDEWTHMAITYNGSQAIIYINGEVDNSSNITIPVEDIINDFFIGGIPTVQTPNPGEYSFPGLIDEFYMSEDPLDQQSIQSLYAI